MPDRPDRFGDSEAPEFLAIGHAARDLLPGGGWRLGGAVTFAALTAQRLGMRAAIITSGPPDLIEALRATLPGVSVAVVPSPAATTFENIYTDGLRRQYLHACAAPLAIEHVPEQWRRSPIVLLAPLAREVAPALAAAFPESLVAATPQGWLRQWDSSGFVTPGPLGPADAALPHLRALILSREDLLAPNEASAQQEAMVSAEAQIAAWARIVPLVVVTRGAEGALLYCDGSEPERFPAYPAREIDPTGAGDVFAAAFLCHLRAHSDPRAAVDFANRVAARSIEREGVAGVPTAIELDMDFGS